MENIWADSCYRGEVARNHERLPDQCFRSEIAHHGQVGGSGAKKKGFSQRLMDSSK